MSDKFNIGGMYFNIDKFQVGAKCMTVIGEYPGIRFGRISDITKSSIGRDSIVVEWGLQCENCGKIHSDSSYKNMHDIEIYVSLSVPSNLILYKYTGKVYLMSEKEELALRLKYSIND